MNALPNIEFPFPGTDGGAEGQMSRTRKSSQGRPDLDRFLEDFISGREPQTTQWIRLASLVASQSFSCDVVIRVLRAGEKAASGTLPIDKLGVSIARKVGAKYSPGRLKRVDGTKDGFEFRPEDAEGSLEQFSFDKSFLPATARVLLIGDHETPMSTVEAIRKAVQDQLPNAEVKTFTLHWLEEHFRTAPLDDHYFLSSESPLSVLSREANPHRPENPRQPAAEERQAPVLTLLPTQAAEPETVPAQKPVASHPQAPRPAARQSRPSPGKKLRIAPWAVIVALGFIVLLVGLVVYAERRGMFASRFEGADANVIPELAEAPLIDPSPTQPAQPVPSLPVMPAKPKGPQGVITVPSAGLRFGPSLDSKPLRKSVRSNERVTILRRRASDAGPDWLQIETSGGSVGWVWASVVREGRGR